MKMVLFFCKLFLLSIILVSCYDDKLVEPFEDTRIHFLIKPWEYSTNHFFLDTVYYDPNINIFENYYGKQPPVKKEFYYVKDITVWQSYTSSISDEEIIANAFYRLPSISPAEEYSESYRDSDNWNNPEVASGLRLIDLVEGRDYTINRYTGLLNIINIPIYFEYRNFAVAYRIEGPTSADEDDLIYGDLDVSEARRSSFEHIAVLKLIKLRTGGQHSSELYEKVGKLQLKNIYHLGNNYISEDDFLFDIYFITDDNKSKRIFGDFGLLNQFGFDKNNDGEFDFRNGFTIFSGTGEIMFPTIEPFGKDIPEIFRLNYEINAIYNQPQEEIINDSNAVRFYFVGKYNLE